MCWRECDITPSQARACGYIKATGVSVSIIPSHFLSTNIMEDISATRGSRAWRPWLNKSSRGRKSDSQKPYERASADKQHFKVSMISHPVKLFWPKSQCFDYLYQDAEILLRNYPVQATISLYEDTETEEEESDGDEADEEEEKELD